MTVDPLRTPESPAGRPGLWRRFAQFLGRHRVSAFVGVVVLGIVVLQWPILKGMFHRAAGTQAPADGIAWRTDFASAMDESKRTRKPLLLDFTASWCPPCKAMKHEVWPDKQVGRAIESSYIPVLLDADSARTQPIYQRYGVSAIPTILIVDGQGRVLRRSGPVDVSGMLRFLEEGARGPGGGT